MKKLLCCGIVAREVEHLLQSRQVEIDYLDPALHVNLSKLAEALESGMQRVGEGAALILGTQCHPEFESITAGKGLRTIRAKNCIEMLLGAEMDRMDNEAKTFYITGGWLENWRSIFIDSLQWDTIDARQNFGYYDRIVLLDTGLCSVDDEMVLEFYEYTQVSIEIFSVSLDHLRELLEQVL